MVLSQKIRIGFFVDSLTRCAGTEKQLIGILANLDPNSVSATIFLLKEPAGTAVANEKGWPVRCLNVHKLTSLSALIKFFRLVYWLRRENLDIAMIYFVDSNLYCVPACRLAGVRTIVINRRDMGYWYTTCLVRVVRWINRLSDYYLVNSIAVRDKVAEVEEFPAERISIIYNGIWERQDIEPKISDQCTDIDFNTPTVGFVGSLRAVKRVDLFIKMASLVSRSQPETAFIVIGCGEQENELRALAARTGLENRISFLGSVSNVWPYLRLFDVGVLTSESEGLSNALIELGTAGVPAVAFDTGGNSEVIQNGVTGFLVSKGDIREMAGIVIRLIQDRDLRCRLSKAARRTCSERFGRQVIMEEIMTYFRTITAPGRTGRKRSWVRHRCIW